MDRVFFLGGIWIFWRYIGRPITRGEFVGEREKKGREKKVEGG